MGEKGENSRPDGPAVPGSIRDFMNRPWTYIEKEYRELAGRTINADNVARWLADWSSLADRISETRARLEVATTVDTTDEQAEKRYHAFLESIAEKARAQDQKLKTKLLETGLVPDGFEIPERNMRAETDLFREKNLPLFTKENKLGTEYDRIVGAQTVQWEGEEVTLTQLQPVYQDTDRGKRERAFRTAAQRSLADREAINGLWKRFMDLRGEIAANADEPDYRSFRWKQWLRFAYTPDDCETFRAAIEKVAVPAATRIYEKRAKRLGVDSLRPWDLSVDPLGREPLRPFDSTDVLLNRASSIFHRVDPQLGAYFDTMRDERLLDLTNRKGKAPGGYCTEFATIGRPFVFMNAVGLHDDVQTLLHEAGHSFHVFEADPLPYHQQKEVPLEFAEVASMSMELLTAPYLAKEEGGFYAPADAARARIEHLEDIILFWPYMAVVDGFQHWVYTHHEEGSDPAKCDETWDALWKRFNPFVDWSGLEEFRATGWHRKLHIHHLPFYYVEYGLAQLGAVQVWRGSLDDPEGAIDRYRKALSLGGTAALPELFSAAGARFAFNEETLGGAVDLVESTIAELEGVQ